MRRNITRKPKPKPESRGGGKGRSKVKKYLPELHTCKDNRKRKAFRIKGRGNTLFVIYKGAETMASKVLIKNKQ